MIKYYSHYKGTILIMDDEESIRNVLSQMLLRLGYEVKSSEDGVEAIKFYREAMQSDKPFDVVLLDLNIRGGMGGMDAIQKLIEIDPDVKGIAISGYYSESTVMSDYKRYGFYAVLTKPFSTFELSIILDKVVTRKHIEIEPYDQLKRYSK